MLVLFYPVFSFWGNLKLFRDWKHKGMRTQMDIWLKMVRD